ncbi:hypothetical protein [Mangrovibrevibacter kandeliae]|uniref:hypothetical protein n=1 Tax=Mangrovibrevibacter kandeliae TaxID=2968473 RepID=UPI0021190AAE|nr:hypothetical protein [Aurantimonas sp. CSK15Z-1]MCQ8780941.1 hypothetical protein [Aurantimonas sp. CSK15Z-1]
MTHDPKRLGRLERLLKVQQQKRALQEWRLAHLRQEGAELQTREEAIIASLGDQSGLQGLFLDAKVKSLKRNDVEKQRNRVAQTDASNRLDAERRKEKQVERARHDAARSQDAHGSRVSLESALESYLQTTDASFE